jgi:hypothetical protein
LGLSFLTSDRSGRRLPPALVFLDLVLGIFSRSSMSKAKSPKSSKMQNRLCEE